MRKTDTNKLEKVKLSAIREIVKKGYFGATISNIAKAAGVSDGYLYSHYKNKEELARTLYVETKKTFHTQLFEILDRVPTVQEYLTESCHLLTEMNRDHPEILEFFVTITHNYHFRYPEEVGIEVLLLGTKIKEKGTATGEISEETEAQDILVTFFGVSSKILELRKKGIVKTVASQESAKHFSKLCLKAWK